MGELSVILVSKFGLDRLERVLETLARQALAERLEIIIVSPFEAPAGMRTQPFAAVRYVRCGPVESVGEPRAAGVAACTTPYLAFGEDHCFPAAGWAEALLGRLREGWVGVGPAIANHNPETWTSRADWLSNYGSFAPGRRLGGQTNYIAPHNSAYATGPLQACGAELARLLQMDGHLQDRLRNEGGQLFFEPAAMAAHTNLSRPEAHWASQFNGSRLYGATRAAHYRWSGLRRWCYAAAWPAIAALRCARAGAPLRNNWRDLPVTPLLAAAATVAAAGEAWGYVAGLGPALRIRSDEEFDRLSGVVAAERHLLLPERTFE